MLLWCILYQRRRWLLPRLRWRMYAKYPANNGAHAGIYSEGAWRRPRYSSVESISLPSLRKLFISNSKFRKFPKFFLKIFTENFWNFSEISKILLDLEKLVWKAPQEKICFVCDYFHLVWKKNLKVEWVEIFSNFSKIFDFIFLSNFWCENDLLLSIHFGKISLYSS